MSASYGPFKIPVDHIHKITVSPASIVPIHGRYLFDLAGGTTVTLQNGHEDGQIIRLYARGGPLTINGVYEKDQTTLFADVISASTEARLRWHDPLAKWIVEKQDSLRSGGIYLGAFGVSGTGPQSIAIGNKSSVLFGDHGGVAIGYNCYSSANPHSAVAIGSNISTTAEGSIVIGKDISINNLSHKNAIIMANYNETTGGVSSYGKHNYTNRTPAVALNCDVDVAQSFAWANKKVNGFSVTQILGVSTTDATPTSMTADGLAVDNTNAYNVLAIWNLFNALMVAPIADPFVSFKITITAREIGTSNVAIFVREGALAVKNSQPYATTLAGAINATLTQAGLIGASVAIAVAAITGPNGDEYLDLKVTGAAAKSIKWLAKIEMLGGF